MPQSSGHKHLNLPLIYVGIPDVGGGSSSSQETNEIKANKVVHANNLREKVKSLESDWNQMDGNGANIPVLLKIDSKVQDLNFLRTAFDFELIVQEDNGYVIALTGDSGFNELEEKIESFIEGSRGGGNVAYLHDIGNEEDRLLRIMGEELYNQYLQISNTDEIILDISVSCEGKLVEPSRGKRDTDDIFNRKKEQYFREYDEIITRREGEMESFLSPYGIHWDQLVEDAGSLIFRVKMTGQCLRDIVKHLKFIFEISIPEEIIHIGPDLTNAESPSGALTLNPPSADSPIIGVIDSGIQEGHSYLSQGIKSGLSKSYLPLTTNPNDFVIPNGHGTRVAGCILYNKDIPTSGSVELPYWLGNIRVLDNDCRMPKSLLPPLLIDNIITNYSSVIKIFNHSINSSAPSRRGYMSAWASKIDELSYHNNIQIVQSIGNIGETTISGLLRSGNNYPNYLNEAICRLANPGQSLQALTIGSLCIDEFHSATLNSIGKKDDLSPFSRVGLGIWDTTKPDLVEYGGSYATDGGGNLINKQELSPELIKMSPPGVPFSRDDIGTSFSTPLITNILGAIQKIFPDESILLYRALITNSAKWPQWAIDRAVNKRNISHILSQIGYGIPHLNDSLYSTDYRTTFFNSNEMPITGGDGHFYKIDIPKAILDSHCDIKVEITLSYKAKPRRTRVGKAGYLSNWVDWETSLLGENIGSFKERMFKGELNQGVSIPGKSMNWMLGKNGQSASKIGRSKGTLQKDWCIIKADEISRDGFHIAVAGHKGWDGLKEFPAYYSIVVSLEAINRDILIYNDLKIANEIEIEIEEESHLEEQIRIDTNLI